MPCFLQHNEHRPSEYHPHAGPLAVKPATAPPTEPHSRQLELASLPHCCRASPVGNGARLKREPWFRQKAFHLHFLNIFFSRATARSPQNARALQGSRPSRVWPGADADGTLLSYFAVANPTKPFPHTSELVLMAHQQLPQCMRTTYACMGG